jgi:hypothetical protein
MHVGDQDSGLTRRLGDADDVRRVPRERPAPARISQVKQTTIDLRELLYSLATISDAAPAPAPGTTKLGKRALELHEDDWRQIEFYSAAHERRVDEHLAAIRSTERRRPATACRPSGSHLRAERRSISARSTASLHSRARRLGVVDWCRATRSEFGR